MELCYEVSHKEEKTKADVSFFVSSRWSEEHSIGIEIGSKFLGCSFFFPGSKQKYIDSN
jgi:hypothetical protein